MFAQARAAGRAVIFIDEIDSICRKRNSKEEETTRRIKNELLKQMDGISTIATTAGSFSNSSGTNLSLLNTTGPDQSGFSAGGSSKNDTHNHLFVLCATNCPWELDTAFLRRFSKRIYIPLPDSVTREALFKIQLKGVAIQLEEDDMGRLVEQTDGYSGSDIANLISEAVMEPIRELRDCESWKWNDDKMSMSPATAEEDSDGTCATMSLRLENIPRGKVQPRNVQARDLFRSIGLNKKTVSQEETVRFHKFTEDFGQNG